jgi:hypothetical protein
VTDRIRSAADPSAPLTEDGLQSDLRHRFDLLDPAALYEMTNVLDSGARKYGDNNWKAIPVESHLNHLLAHVFAYLSGDRTVDHLSNAFCRAMFASGRAILDQKTPAKSTDTVGSEPGQHEYDGQVPDRISLGSNACPDCGHFITVHVVEQKQLTSDLKTLHNVKCLAPDCTDDCEVWSKRVEREYRAAMRALQDLPPIRMDDSQKRVASQLLHAALVPGSVSQLDPTTSKP